MAGEDTHQREHKESGIMHSFTNISKPRFGRTRSGTTSDSIKIKVTITLKHSDNPFVPKTFTTGDEIEGYVTMEMPEPVKFDNVSITLEGEQSNSL